MTSPRRSWLETWRRRLRTLAGGAIPADPEARAELVRTFRDERGQRRAIDEPILRWVTRDRDTRDPHRPSAYAPGPRPPAEHAPPESRDLALWRALLDGRRPRLPEAEGPRPIIDPDDHAAIELWTESELACLHALWWHARRPDAEAAARRAAIARAVRWHLDTLQPDNGTHHAWAAHVFIDAAWRPGGELDPEADLHAQGLVHAATFATGRPDALSALLLHDAAEAVDLLIAGHGPRVA